MKKTLIVIEDETCVCCGKAIKFGQMVCDDCMAERPPLSEESAKCENKHKIIRNIKERFSK